MDFRDLKMQYNTYKSQIDHAIQKTINDANFIEGNEVRELEQLLGAYVGVKNCITCANGTDAMSLLMMAWGIKEGDAVFVPDFTFFSTGEIVSLCGATPIFVDVCKDTFNIDPIQLEQAIWNVLQEGKLKPRVIIPVDLFGLPADHYEIEEIAKRYNLLVLEDAAQGFGGKINDKKACSFGDASTTSFFPAKPLGCYGDGGAIFTNDDTLAELIRSLKVHGKGKNKYDNFRIGLNSRLDTMQAAILIVKFKAFVEHELDKVNQVYENYKSLLAGAVSTPFIPSGYYSSFAQYTIKLRDKYQRNELQKKLMESGIPSMIYYEKPLHKQRAFSYLNSDDTLYPISNTLSETVLSLPMHPYLTKEQISKISDLIKEFLNSAG
ncbi:MULTISPECIES: DegT/DnrJ/EryC1/StrS family aminotransferase [Paenibacillus]|uniref:DegT/DnrJ/EryC1/StrS family aminotransferase n=1 Tax=Paenibacillus TaxID=44249 RepID=UPI0005CF3B92|nr:MULTISPECIES: DegT/DnrJ/EryC1/StrS family aminotransferase [Paenibacillus]KAF6587340.1 DegT/DnrJ/EryC1/StrS family aminotransferase [Paenibacillus sp. EKM211P]KJD40282.1 aminotransferase DegT [Paenibacillus polymyxa]